MQPVPARPVTAKAFTHGTHRVCAPAETLLRIQDALPAFGITRVADVTGLDTVGIPVYVCVRPNARSLSVSQGKGLDRQHAKVSAIMESIELFHAERPCLPTTTGSYAALRARGALDPRTLALYPNGYYNDALALEWVSARDIARGEQVLVPYDLVHCDFTRRDGDPPPCFVVSSNGLASGNTRMEAVGHAICELLERDATGLFVRSGCFSVPRLGDFLIDLDSVADAHFAELRGRIERAGLRLYAWNETPDIGVPVIGCALIETRGDSRSGVYCGGHGCHPDKRIALARAVTEAAQSRLTEISGARDDLCRSHYQLAASHYARRAGQAAFDALPARVDFDDLPSFATDDVEGDVRALIERLGRHGYERVCISDLGGAGHGIAVVKAVIPGLGDFGDGLDLPRSNLRP